MRKMLAACCGCMLMLLLGGCWSRHELNELSIVSGLGVDKFKNNGYMITVQIVNPGQFSGKGGTGGYNPVVTYSGEGATIPDALGRLTTQIPRQLYFAHLRLLVLSEAVAKLGISSPLDFVSRNKDMRTDFNLIVSKGTTAASVLKINTPIDPIPADQLLSKLETSDKLWAATGKVNLGEILTYLYRPGTSPALTGVEVVGDLAQAGDAGSLQEISPLGRIAYSGMAAFRRDKLVGWLNEDDTKVMNYVQNRVHRTIGFIDSPDGKGKITLEISRAKSSIKPHLRNGALDFDVYVRGEMDIADVESALDLTNRESQEQIEQLIDKKFEQQTEKTIRKVQSTMKTDVFGFGDAFHRAYPKEWHKIKDWEAEFAKATVRAHADFKIRRMGTTIQSVEKETKL